MEIYFIRHGETNGNVARRHQAEHSPLTFKGEEEVRKAALLIKALKPTHLMTSSLVRALDTAKVIGKECDLVPDTFSYLNELKRPDKLYGNYHFSIGSFIFYFKWFLGREGKESTDGESYADLLKRIEIVKEKVASLPPDAKLVIVSHSVFINFFVAHMCQTKKLNVFQATKTFFNLLTMPNTQIKAVTYNPETNSGQCAWSVNLQN
ncbi:histidine phosphatase family protein [Candidatus Kaiserbacteria bacterium]|nr:histidine phosphatase family protein [Candidatus Kaiserbacteria bacterium]